MVHTADNVREQSAVPAQAPSTHEKSEGAFKTISETAKLLGVPQHVLRFWESRFRQVRPLKLKGGRRYYRPEDIEILQQIQALLYKQGYTIKGARKALEKQKRNKLDKIAKQMPAELRELPEEAEIEVVEEQVNTDSQPQADSQELDTIRQDLLSMRAMLQEAMKD